MAETSETDPLVGQRVAQYEIVRKLGQGGMGVVYLARHVTLEREVAIKFLATHLLSDPEYVDRFLREARAAGKLNHPNIIAVYDAGTDDGVFYFVMEYVQGRDASHILEENKSLDEAFGVEIARKSALALAYAHKAGIVHRDIKPENLIITNEGEIKVGDLGLAKQIQQEESSSLTQTGVVMGTPYYISPEQIRGKKQVDHRSDIYSLGASLYHMLVGYPPFNGDSPVEIMSNHLTEPFPWPQLIRPELSEGVCRIICKMMEKNPDDRFQSMEEVGAMLDQLQSGQTQQVNESVDISGSKIGTDPSQMSTAGGTHTGALTAPHQAAPSASYNAPAVSSDPTGAHGQPSIYMVPPKVMANRIAGGIGLAIVVTALLSGLLWFFLLKPKPSKTPKPDLDELARRAGVFDTAPKQNEVAKKMEGPKEAPMETPKAPTPPPETPKTETSTTPPTTSPPETLIHPPASGTPSGSIQNDFDAETAGALPQKWRAYIQESVARGEKSKQPFWTTTSQYTTPDGASASWEIFKTPEAFNGSQVLRLVLHLAPDQKVKYRSGVNGTVHVVAGKKYTMTFHARAGSEPVKASVRVGAPGVAVRDQGVDLIDEWKEVKTQFEPMKEGDISISIILTTPGELWLDDIQFVEVAAS